jgi:eukaryotic-like serine/threonine-protein kinase
VALKIGSRLGPYEILELLGAGGMGEVYKARDTRLGRIVAIKILRSPLASDAEFHMRLEREARVVSQLDHPHICALYDVGEEYGQSFLVMQYLDGATLTSRLTKGPLPLDQALRYAIEIASALDKAHRHGVTHRDLKPGNIMLTKGGAKLLDFGLAKAGAAIDARDELSLVSSGVLNLTRQGTILGTFHYMAPEQLEGGTADARTDIFAFGCVLYEMLTGRKAFDGATQASVIGAILKDEPAPIASIQPIIPASLVRVVRKCLAKDPDERWQSVRDLQDELRWIAEGRLDSNGSTVAATVAPRSRTRRLASLGAAAVVAFAALAAGFAGGMRAGRVAPPDYQQLTFRHGSISAARFTSDGQTIVYGAAWDNAPVQLSATRIESTESRGLGIEDADLFAISSTGEMAITLGRRYALGVVGRGTLARMPLDASTPRTVLGDVEDADWSPDGGNLAVVRLVEGKQRLEFPIGSVLYETAGGLDHVRMSRDGANIAFIDHPSPDDDRGAIALIPAKGGSRRVLSDGWSSVTGLAWSASGDEIWFTAAEAGVTTSLYAVDLSGRVRVVMRSASRLLIHDIDRAGRLLMTVSKFRLRIGMVDLSANDRAERDLSWLDGSVVTDVSPDGSTLVINEQGAGARSPRYAVYLRKADGSPAIRIGEGSLPTLSPDGGAIAAVILGPSPSIALIPTAAGQPRTLDRGTLTNVQTVAWFPDGRRLLLSGSEAGRGLRLWTQAVRDGIPVPVSPEGVRVPAGSQPISPDGTHAAALDSSERVWVHALQAGEEPRLVEGLEPGDVPIRWSGDGQSLYTFRYGELPATVYRFHLTQKRKERIATLMPSDAAGVRALETVQITPDARRVFYTYSQILSDLFLVTNVN